MSDGSNAAAFSVMGTTVFSDTSNPGWHHVEVCRTGSTVRLFIDGAQEASGSIGFSINSGTAVFSVGRAGDQIGTEWKGWLDEFRLRVGPGVGHTSSFTPSLRAYGALSDGIALPSDYLAWRRLTWTGQTRSELEFVHPSYLQAAYPSSPAGVPRIFTIEGSTLKIMPLDSTALEFDYFQKVPALASLPGGANWLLNEHPDLYLFGSMVEAEMFGVNDDRAPLWKARRDEIFDELVTLNNKTRGPSAIRVMGVTP